MLLKNVLVTPNKGLKMLTMWVLQIVATSGLQVATLFDILRFIDSSCEASPRLDFMST